MNVTLLCFFFLPSTTDFKELINQYMEKVSLLPVNCVYEKFQEFSPTKNAFILINLDAKKIDLMLLK